MKQIILITLLSFPVYLFANPISPGAKISEIYFDEYGEWTLEIWFDLPEDIDSIIIKSEEDSITLRNFDQPDLLLQVITSKDLNDNSFIINKDSDRIVIHSFISHYVPSHDTTYYNEDIDAISIGNYPGSYLHNIQNGQSIARVFGTENGTGPFFKDNSPTIGSINDYNGSIGTIYGHFYYENSELITNKSFNIMDGYSYYINYSEGTFSHIHINEEGFYCAKITSRSYSFDKIYLYDDLLSGYMQFQPISFEVNENDSINIDFNALTSSISAKKENNVLLSNYPNPACDYTYFIFNPEILNKSDATITVYDIKGNSIAAFNPSTQCYKWDCSTLSKGTYLYSLSINNQIVASQKLQIVK